MQNITHEYTRILALFLPNYKGFDTPPILYRLAVQLRQRLTSSLTHLPSSIICGMDNVVKGLDSMRSAKNSIPQDIASDIENLIKEFQNMEEMIVLEQVRTTRIVEIRCQFCNFPIYIILFASCLSLNSCYHLLM
jgi:hypothetical protein